VISGAIRSLTAIRSPPTARSIRTAGARVNAGRLASARVRENARMAFDEALAQRIRRLLETQDDVVEMRMMGGLAFLIAGNMAVTASGRGGLMLRVEPSRTEELAARPHAGRVVMRGREVDGWVRVAAAGVESETDLRAWVDRGVAYARSLPPKD
jgi:hypothetical protein